MPEKFYKTDYDSPAGKIILTCDSSENLTGLRFEWQNGIKPDALQKDNLDIFKRTKNWLDAYFRKENPDAEHIPVKLYGSDFQQEVWQILRTIPYGEVMTYGEIAKIIAKARNMKVMSSQAVGTAIAHNPVLIIVPCHRVISSNGNLGGYSAGKNIKRTLLELEGLNIFF